MASDQRPAPRVRFDPALGWALVGVVAVAIVVGAALILTSPEPVDAPGGASSASPSESASVVGLAIPGPPEELEHGTWVRIGWREADDLLPHDGVSIGRMDGTVTAELPFTGDTWARGYGVPFVRGPSAGMVLVATGEGGGRVAFDMLDAATGQITRAGTVEGPVTDAILSRDATQLFFLAGDDTGLAVARMATDGSGAVAQIAPARPRVARADGIVLAAAIRRHAALVLSPDETAVAVADCFTACEVRLISLATGEEQMLRGFDGTADALTWSDAGLGIGSLCVDPDTGLPTEATCTFPDLETSFGTSVELPEGWRHEIRPIPDAPPLSFAVQVIAIGPDGEEVVLDALGAFNGNG